MCRDTPVMNRSGWGGRVPIGQGGAHQPVDFVVVAAADAGAGRRAGPVSAQGWTRQAPVGTAGRTKTSIEHLRLKRKQTDHINCKISQK